MTAPRSRRSRSTPRPLSPWSGPTPPRRRPPPRRRSPRPLGDGRRRRRRRATPTAAHRSRVPAGPGRRSVRQRHAAGRVGVQEARRQRRVGGVLPTRRPDGRHQRPLAADAGAVGADPAPSARTPASTSRSTCRCRCWRCSTRTTRRSSSPHVSTGGLNPDGTDATFCEKATYTTDIYGNALAEPETKQICAESKTPPGVFRLKRYEDGQHVSPLGGMKNPWYFNYGIAIHGAQNVPNHPASHGCVRMSNALADVFPTLVEKGNAVYVWGYDGREPEGYTEKEIVAVVQPARPERHDDHHHVDDDSDHHDRADDGRSDDHGARRPRPRRPPLPRRRRLPPRRLRHRPRSPRPRRRLAPAGVDERRSDRRDEQPLRPPRRTSGGSVRR